MTRMQEIKALRAKLKEALRANNELAAGLKQALDERDAGFQGCVGAAFDRGLAEAELERLRGRGGSYDMGHERGFKDGVHHARGYGGRLEVEQLTDALAEERENVEHRGNVACGVAWDFGRVDAARTALLADCRKYLSAKDPTLDMRANGRWKLMVRIDEVLE